MRQRVAFLLLWVIITTAPAVHAKNTPGPAAVSAAPSPAVASDEEPAESTKILAARIEKAVAEVRYLTDSDEFAPAERREKAKGELTAVMKEPQLAAAILYLGEKPRESFMHDLLTILRRGTEDSVRGQRQQKLLQEVGFDRLAVPLGVGEPAPDDERLLPPSPVSTLFHQLQDYDREILRRLQAARAENRNLRERLIRQEKLLERGMFVTNLLAIGGAFGAFAYVGGPLIGLAAAPAKVGGMLAGSWLATSVLGFEGYWPTLRRSLVHGLPAYRRLRQHFIETLLIDGDRAIKPVARLASAQKTQVSPLQMAAYEALVRTDTPGVTRALVELGVRDMKNGLWARARQIFNEVQKRELGSGLGDFARSALEVLDARDAYNHAQFWFEARYVGKNVLKTGALLAAGVLSSYFLLPHAVTVGTAVISGLGFWGAWKALGALWVHYPEAELNSHMAQFRQRYLASLRKAMGRAESFDADLRATLRDLRDSLEATDKQRSDGEDERTAEALACDRELGKLGAGANGPRL